MNQAINQLQNAMIENLHALFRAMGDLPGAIVKQEGAVARHLAAPFNPMFKGAWQNSGRDFSDAEVEETVAWFKSRAAPFFFWWVDGRVNASEQSKRLQAHGFVAWEENAPAMGARLDALRYDLIGCVPVGYEQSRVVDQTGLLNFKEAFVKGYDVPEWAAQAWVDATLAFGIDHAPWQCYVGRLHGRPVACTILFVGGGAASVFGVATVPEARGQGIGAAITLMAYRDALQMGYAHGVLFASEMGLPVYRRIGMDELGSTVSRYLWRA